MARFDLENYVQVQDRIVQFWARYPDGRIITALTSDPADFTQCRYRADVYRDAADSRPAASGWAFELAGGSGPNATSHEENCETSAIGRALANLGFAKDAEARPSREEMTKAAAGRHPAAKPVMQEIREAPQRPTNGGTVSREEWLKMRAESRQ